MQTIFEFIFYVIVDLIVDIFGVNIRYLILKQFNPQLNYEDFSQIKSEWHTFYNVCVGLVILFGLIFGIAFIVFK